MPALKLNIWTWESSTIFHKLECQGRAFKHHHLSEN
jgi:hypothetical protein